MTTKQIEKERQAFEDWHKKSNQAVKYKLRHTSTIGTDGDIHYHDYRTNWAFIAFKAGRQSVTEQSAWISVEDTLPELDTPVHAVFDDHVGIFARCDDDNGGWLWARCYGTSSWDNYGDWLQDDDYQSITHWKPLPTPPKENK